MTDLEMTRLCAEAMGLRYQTGYDSKAEYADSICLYDSGSNLWHTVYDPLHDDAQAMALVKRFGLFLGKFSKGDYWCVETHARFEELYHYRSDDLNRAIVNCVARMQKSKK